jgi:tetrahydromethanopterin S-methyltransferase subunit G
MSRMENKKRRLEQSNWGEMESRIEYKWGELDQALGQLDVFVKPRELT